MEVNYSDCKNELETLTLRILWLTVSVIQFSPALPYCLVMRNAYHVSNNKSANNQLLRGEQDL